MPNTNYPQHKRQGKVNTPFNEPQTIFQYLQEHDATVSMVSDATGICQRNICRYKRDLEKAGLLWEIEKKTCKKTGFKAWYLTTNPGHALIQSRIQLNLFEL